jgi:hypothetical protein
VPLNTDTCPLVEPWLTALLYPAAMTDDDFLRALPLANRLRIAAVDLAMTGASREVVEAVSIAGIALTEIRVRSTVELPTVTRSTRFPRVLAKCLLRTATAVKLSGSPIQHSTALYGGSTIEGASVA